METNKKKLLVDKQENKYCQGNTWLRLYASLYIFEA